MARDWTKMRTDLYRDPKVCMMADMLMDEEGDLGRFVNQNRQRDMTVTRNVMRNATVGALVSVWGVFRHRGKRVDDDLFVAGATLDVIDDVSDMPGFGQAMSSVGWAVESEEGVVFPRFFEDYNVDPVEELKKKNAERQKRHREKNKETSNVTRNVTVAPNSNAREEKSREENNTPPPPNGGKRSRSKPTEADPLFAQFWEAYPRKVAKSAAIKAWFGVPPSPEILAAILAALQVQSRSVQWRRENGAYIPHPASWLNGRRWEDQEPVQAAAAESASNREQELAETRRRIEEQDRRAADIARERAERNGTSDTQF